MTPPYQSLDQWIDEHFDEQVAFLQALVQCPTDTPPGNNAPHARLTAQRLTQMGLTVTEHEVPADVVHAAGLQSIINLIVRHRFGDNGLTIALNAHGDVVPPGDGWQHPPYGGDLVDGCLYGRAAAVSKSDFSTYTFALRALQAIATTLPPEKRQGQIELHFTYDEEFGGLCGPDWLLSQGLTKPDMLLAAGFSYQVVVAHNGCLQLEVTVVGEMAHAAIPDTGTDALQAAHHIMSHLYALNADYLKQSSHIEGIDHPYLNIGHIQGGTNTNVIPGQVTFKLDRRMIPEENPEQVEADLRSCILQAAANYTPPRGERNLQVHIKRLLLAHAMVPLPNHRPLAERLQHHATLLLGEPIPMIGTPLYTDVRLYVERGIPGVIYGAGPRTVRESNAKRADEHLVLHDLRQATKIVARTLCDLLFFSNLSSLE